MLSRTLKWTFFGASRATGANWALRRILGRRGGRILCYHGIVENGHRDEPFLYRNTVSVRQFQSQLEFLNRHFHPISAGDLIDHMCHRATLKPRSVLLTFDDGYRNNLTYAAPLLRKYGTPALFSLTTGYIGGRDLLWPDEMNLRILNWPLSGVPCPSAHSDLERSSPGPGFATVPVPSGQQARVQLAERIRSVCKSFSDSARLLYLNELRQQHCPALEQVDRELYDFLSWDEVRSLVKSGFEIGSHTVTHPILTRITSQQLVYELVESKVRIEAEIGKCCTCLVYPNGQISDFSPEIEHSASSAGYLLGFIATGSYASVNRGSYRLDRIGVPGQQPHAVFESRVSGLHTWAKRFL
jgi:peptidoglycan/xylan/chitin deacetylase (PgdA/CDA1 family)